MKKQIWYNGTVDYIGATGVDTVRQMAELAAADRSIVEALDIIEWPASVHIVETALHERGVEALAVPVAAFRNEVWEGQEISIHLEGRPGRGRIKVLGTSL